MSYHRDGIQGLPHLTPPQAEALVNRWTPGDEVVLEVSAEQFTGRYQSYLPEVSRWTFEGLHREHRESEKGYILPQFIQKAHESMHIRVVRFDYSEITAGIDQGRTKVLRVAPWPDVLPNNLESCLPLSGESYQRKWSLLTRIDLDRNREPATEVKA